jgi:hypothetical protein
MWGSSKPWFFDPLLVAIFEWEPNPSKPTRKGTELVQEFCYIGERKRRMMDKSNMLMEV